jgi:hypothetical protein
LDAVNVIVIGAAPLVASPVVGVAEIEVLIPAVGDDPGGTGAVDLSPPPQATSTAAAASDRNALRATLAANPEVMSIVLAPSSPSGFFPAANCAFVAPKKNS